VPLLDPGRRTGTVGDYVGMAVRLVDPVAGVSLTFTASGLPPGLLITRWGRIKGYLTTTGTYWAKASVTASNTLTGTVGSRWIVNP